MKKLLILLFILLPVYVCRAQTDGKWKVDWSTAVRMSGATGRYVPFWARTGEDGILPVRSSVLVTAGTDVTYTLDPQWSFSAGVNLVGVMAQKSPLNPSPAYGLVDRLYATASWRMIHLDLGMKPRHGDLGPLSVTGGDIMMSGNSRNMPGVNLRTDWMSLERFGWFAIKANLAHYHMIDRRVARGTMLHDKSVSARLSLGQKVDLMGGLRHYAMWGGVSAKEGPLGSSLRDYIKVFFASRGDEEDLMTDQLNAFGNHLGTEWIRLVWKADRFTMTFQYDKFFEDNSGKNFRNAPDGVWTLNLAFPDRKAPVTDITYEFINSTWQSGPLHDRPATEEEMADQDPEDPWYGKICLGGMDDYFNNYPYGSGWTYYGRAIGLPLLIPAAPGPDGISHGILNNRVRGHHVAMAGVIVKVPYRLKATFTRNFGRYVAPLEGAPWQLSLALETFLNEGLTGLPTDFSVGLYADIGRLYQNSAGLTLLVRLANRSR